MTINILSNEIGALFISIFIPLSVIAAQTHSLSLGLSYLFPLRLVYGHQAIQYTYTQCQGSPRPVPDIRAHRDSCLCQVTKHTRDRSIYDFAIFFPRRPLGIDLNEHLTRVGTAHLPKIGWAIHPELHERFS